jgi:PAS domain S-box-containing protein
VTLSRHLLLILIVLLGGATLILAAGGQYFVRQWVEANLLESAEKVRNVLMATRRVYQHQFIDSGLPIDDKTLGFLPAHALHRISNDLQHWDKSGFTFNNVSDHPRNPFNQADAVEMAAIEHFRTNPDAELRFTPFTNAGGDHYYLYARPIRVEKYCLQCHGDKKQAPETIQLHYDEAFGYQEGDLRGILSIKVPAMPLEAQAQASLLALLGTGIITLGLLGIGIAWAVGRNVIRPLTVLEKHIHEVTSGDLSKPIKGLRGEFAQVGEAYNRMAANLAHKRAQLEESENRFRTIFEQSALGKALVRPDGHWLRVNKKLCDFLGYNESELLTKTFQDITHPDDLAGDLDQVRRMLSREIESYTMKKRYIRKDGKAVWANLSVALVRTNEGQPDYFISAIDDINDRIMAVQARHAAEKALLEAQTAALEEQREARRAALSLLEDATAARRHAEAAEMELRVRNEELERFNQAMIGRELDMVELKQRINALSKELGREPPFNLAFLEQSSGDDKASNGS